MNVIRFERLNPRWTHCAGIVTLLALWSGAALSLPDNPKDPPLPPSTMGGIFEDSGSRTVVRRYAAGQDCTGNVGILRLQDGNMQNEGRLELCADLPDDGHGPLWGVVCDDYWTDEDSGVACRQMGYKREEANTGRFLQSFFGAGSGPFVLDDMLCEGSESQLLDCAVFGGMVASTVLGAHNCRKTETVGIRCLNTTGDASLQDLYVRDSEDMAVTIVPGPWSNTYIGFEDGLLNYYTQTPVPVPTSELTVFALTNDTNASIEYFDNSRTSLGTGPTLHIRNLAMGWTRIEIDVTADDGTVLTYSLNIDQR